jgi:hypothetical protein
MKRIYAIIFLLFASSFCYCQVIYIGKYDNNLDPLKSDSNYLSNYASHYLKRDTVRTNKDLFYLKKVLQLQIERTKFEAKSLKVISLINSYGIPSNFIMPRTPNYMFREPYNDSQLYSHTHIYGSNQPLRFIMGVK